MSMISLKHIARDLDVSISLVSKVLSGNLGNTGVRPQLQEAIRQRAAKLGFQRNTSALALRKGRHNVIGVLVHRLGMTGSGIIEDLLDGLSSAALHNRQRLVLSFFKTAVEFKGIADMTHRAAVDGVIVAGIRHTELEKNLLTLSKGGIPIVTVHEEPLNSRFVNIGIDQVAVTKLATQHLIDRGCRRIVHISNVSRRRQGYLDALAANKLHPEKYWVFEVPAEYSFSHTAGEMAVKNFIDNRVDFDGLVAQSDQEAAGAINALFKAGRRVPEEVRVIGVDNAPYCEFSRIPISSVSQEFKQRGALAIKAILDKIEGRPVPLANIPPVLVMRDSTR